MADETIVIAADHAGFELKQVIKAELEALGFDVHDLGTHDTESVDYPDFADALASAVLNGHARQHNDANVLVLGGRVTSAETARDCLRIFLDTPFEGGRHTRRVAKLA